jgi:hypothetical protein
MPTLTVETGSGSDPNANCYIALADAVTYHDNRLHTEAWDSADSDARKQALIMATRVVDANCIFRGYKKLSTQPLQWPRVRARNDEVAGSIGYPYTLYAYLYYDENSIPPALAQATALEALELLRGDRTTDPGAPGISSLGLGQGAVSLTFNAMSNPGSTSDEVRRILAPMVRGFRSSRGGSRHVTRIQ